MKIRLTRKKINSTKGRYARCECEIAISRVINIDDNECDKRKYGPSGTHVPEWPRTFLVLTQRQREIKLFSKQNCYGRPQKDPDSVVILITTRLNV